MKSDTDKAPKHIGVILDGNRRFAKKQGKPAWKGHKSGAEKVSKFLEWCKELGIKEATLYCFSVENFKRSKEEVTFLIKLFKDYADKILKEPKVDENQLKINFIGRIEMFPKELQERMHKIMEKTKNYNKYVLNLCVAYGGRTEITDTAKKIAQQVKDNKLNVEDIDEEVFRKNLYLGDYPDLIIRTGDVVRISNFLSFQGAYSEYFFLKKTWPEFEKEDLIKCIEEFKMRERRFGK